jgi:hypothetical protein
MSAQPRLFADYATNPTRREREIDKLRAMRNQPTIFDLEPATAPEPEACPVCAGDHPEADCTHGTAPTLPEPDTQRSGFDWDDTEFRFCCRTDTHYAYGPTPEVARTKFDTLNTPTTEETS